MALASDPPPPFEALLGKRFGADKTDDTDATDTTAIDKTDTHWWAKTALPKGVKFTPNRTDNRIRRFFMSWLTCIRI